MGKWRYDKGLQELGNGLFAYLQPDGGFGYSNAGLVVGDAGEALLVDTLIDLPLTREMLAAMKRAAPQARINTVLNTHAHPDHTAGNILLEGAEIIASAAAFEEMKFIAGPNNPIEKIMAHWQDYGEAGAYLHEVMGRRFEPLNGGQLMPTRTFETALDLQVGGKEVKLMQFGPAHTNGDALAYLPQERVVFTGDLLFHEVHPLLNMIPVAAWIAACERILALDVEIVVPGHGPLTDKSGAQKLIDYLSFLTTETRRCFAAGLSLPEAVAAISLDAFRGWADEERVFINVASLYREFGAPETSMLEVLTLTARYRRQLTAHRF